MERWDKRRGEVINRLVKLIRKVEVGYGWGKVVYGVVECLTQIKALK